MEASFQSRQLFEGRSNFFKNRQACSNIQVLSDIANFCATWFCDGSRVRRLLFGDQLQ
jgi:hypothetical protein